MKDYQSEEVLTILTNPIPSLFDFYIERLKSFIRPALRKIDGKQPLTKIKYGGHYAVTRSLVEGLEKAGIAFVYNPKRLKECTGKVIVLAGLQTLKKTLLLKNTGKIKLLAAGPNLVIMPSDSTDIISSKLIDKFIVNSEWIKNAYCSEMPQLLTYTVIWPAGVDELYWKPDETIIKKNTILFYAKRPQRDMYEKCKAVARQKGLEVIEIIYGNYTPVQYKDLLNQSCWLVHFVEQESQGISLLESWAMDVPTIVWNPGTHFLKGLIVPSSSAPYLSSDTGIFFKDENSFEECINQILSHNTNFNPRDWVLKNMTDKIAAKNLIALLT